MTPEPEKERKQMDFERVEKMPETTRRTPMIDYRAALAALRKGPIRLRVPEGKKAHIFANTITAGISSLGVKVSRNVQGGFVYLELKGDRSRD